MAFVSDILLLFAALAAAFYCRILASRLRALGQMDQGLGGAISSLNIQVSEMKAALDTVAIAAARQSETLHSVTAKADKAARRLELLLAGLHHEEANEQKNNCPKVPINAALFDRPKGGSFRRLTLS